jgi:hypothetical protein
MTVNTAANGSRDGGVGRHTTAPPPVDPAIIAPGIEQYLRTTVRLHPRAGDPGPHDSHVDTLPDEIARQWRSWEQETAAEPDFSDEFAARTRNNKSRTTFPVPRYRIPHAIR